ncbi:SAM-dependent methyltransferase [Saccharothrix tamanrassetensis]|uniref:SAM-dependent methyltransferase n=1 Tax=Saccharothrix tamanrassetensis TaxID=1051531 RepID=A0A841CKB9_9PSEU|nr:class I SAM-dependent methyltransferase [Saccharothrix tamanrassetensis]MBB5957961.1 SAM-dependent methyltransferase [Saccharothrix tamanrassetensis]
MDLRFRGDVVDFYQRYRRGYPDAAVDLVVDEFSLSPDDVVLDLGCGTGQLTVPFAGRVRAVVGVDPEPDMLARARQVAKARGVPNVSWMVADDTDVASLGTLLSGLGAVTIGQALHWMDHPALFHALKPLLRPGGGVAVFTNGTPLWLQDSDWSRALNSCLEELTGTRATRTCGTDEETQQRYAADLAAAGYEVRARSVEYTEPLGVEEIVGNVFSALSVDDLPPPERRRDFTEQVGRALEPHAPFIDHVNVRVLTGRS